MSSLLTLLGKLELRKISQWSAGSDDGSVIDAGVPADIHDANVVRSVDGFYGRRHHVLLDLDRQAHLVPSSTSGHFHLYVDMGSGVDEAAYFRFLDAAADIGLIQRGYVNASKARGGSYLRLPWVKKGTENA
jgi:hypothetical protein